MKTLEIACDINNWNNSDITIIGLSRNGRISFPVTIKAAELEQPLLAMWEGLVASLKTVAPNEWAAQYIDCALTTNEETGEEVVNLTIHRKWDDNTTAEPVYMQMGGMAVTFFKCLTEK